MASHHQRKKTATEQVRRHAAVNGGSFELALTGGWRKVEPLDVVIASAGVMATPFGHTADSFETQFGTNRLGHFVSPTRRGSVDEKKEGCLLAQG